LKFEEIQLLIGKYLSGVATQEEIAVVEQWYENLKGKEAEGDEQHFLGIKDEIRQQLFTHIQTPKVKPMYSYLKWAAAVLVIGLTVTFYTYNRMNTDAPSESAKNAINDAPPGGDRATLTLADGSKVLLDNQKQGQLANQGAVQVSKTEEGMVTYSANLESLPKQITYNILSTPRGGKYKIELSDGTKVWLNAATTFKYPTTFAGKNRKVELSGEAYFEVAKNVNMPFIVVSANGGEQTLEVLGTHFNVNAYADESKISTTLLEGSVKIATGQKSIILKPGQQSAINNTAKNQEIKIIDDANVEEATAWKNDFFQFENADIQTILKQISRWYDVDIVYENTPPDGHYKGKVSRSLSAANALKILNYSGMNFRIEGKKIIVK
jgi:transmembrane sensor